MVDYGGFGLQHHEQSSITRHMANKIDKNRLGLDLPTVTQQQHAAKCSNEAKNCDDSRPLSISNYTAPARRTTRTTPA